jgi:hypothetical protein
MTRRPIFHPELGLPETAALPVSPLRFWVNPGNAPAYEIDLTEFAKGGKRENVAPTLRDRWGGDFAGRPALAGRLADMYRILRPSEQLSAKIRATMRTFYRFLDAIDPVRQVSDIADVNDGHGVEFLSWLEKNNGDVSGYRHLKTVLDRLRTLEALPSLFWPPGPREHEPQQEDIDQRAIQRLYNALKAEAREIKAMFREGERLADEGEDPRGGQYGPLYAPSAWDDRANHAWLIRELTRARLLSKQEFKKAGARGLNQANDVETQLHYGPEYLAPLMTERGRQGIVGKLRWFYPSYHDVAIYLWIFLIGTGWNLSTALSLDVSEDDAWFEPHSNKADFVVLHAWKGRAGRHQLALSLREPEWHPFQIVRWMVERTAPLRRTIRHRLEQVRARHRAAPSPATASEIAHLEADLRSPWLYHIVNKIGQVSAFRDMDSHRLGEIAREVVRRHGLGEQHPELESISTSAARDAWIGHVYVQSGFHVTLTTLASGHANARTLRHYLNRRSYREHGERVIRRWQGAVFDEIEAGQVLDATRIRLLMQKGKITPEQERRLLDGRQRTRLGMGCLDPLDPPREIEPDHRPGSLCSVQRCVGCRHGVVVEESLPALARAYAELLYLKETIPLAAWAGSSLEEEADALEATLERFDTDRVQAAVDDWRRKIHAKEVVLHDTFPASI